MIKFPLTKLLDEQACYEWLLKLLHPQGLHCPNGHALPEGQAPHDRKRTPIVKYKCRECGKVFHIFTGTDLSGSHYNCSQIVSNVARILTRTDDATYSGGIRTGLWDGISLAASYPTPRICPLD
jgi:transposase-like protein